MKIVLVQLFPHLSKQLPMIPQLKSICIYDFMNQSGQFNRMCEYVGLHVGSLVDGVVLFSP